MLGPIALLNLYLSIGHSLMAVKKVLEHLVRDPSSEIKGKATSFYAKTELAFMSVGSFLMDQTFFSL